jgi:integrase
VTDGRYLWLTVEPQNKEQNQMPKSANFKPIKQENRKHPWMLSIPANLSSTGKRQQLFFPSKKEAETAAEQFKTRKDNFGNSLTSLSPAILAEAAQGVLEMQQAGIKESLLFAIRTGIGCLRKRMTSMTLDELFEQYLDLKQEKSAPHKKRLRTCRNRFRKAGKGNLLLSDLSLEDFEPTLKAMPPTSRKHESVLLKGVFNYAVRKEYLEKNPLGKLDPIELDRKPETEVVRADDVEKLLQAALEHDRDLLPTLVLGFYAGIRPEGELSKILWSDVSLERKEVTVPYNVSKTHTRRIIPLSDNAIAWLRLCKPARLIMPCSVQKVYKRRHELWVRVSNEKYPRDGMRHSFCSYHVALMEKQEEIFRLQLHLGHTNGNMLWQHYRAVVERNEAEKFWSIVP